LVVKGWRGHDKVQYSCDQDRGQDHIARIKGSGFEIAVSLVQTAVAVAKSMLGCNHGRPRPWGTMSLGSRDGQQTVARGSKCDKFWLARSLNKRICKQHVPETKLWHSKLLAFKEIMAFNKKN
jgi:hypothetical protein